MRRLDRLRSRRIIAGEAEIVQCQAGLTRKQRREHPQLVEVRRHGLLRKLSDLDVILPVFVEGELHHRGHRRGPALELSVARVINAGDIFLRERVELCGDL